MLAIFDLITLLDNNNSFNSVMSVSLEMGLTYPYTHKLLNRLENLGYVILLKEGRCVSILRTDKKFNLKEFTEVQE